MKSRDPKMHHWATVKRDLMFGEEMINCPLCNYPAKKDENGKGLKYNESILTVHWLLIVS